MNQNLINCTSLSLKQFTFETSATQFKFAQYFLSWNLEFKMNKISTEKRIKSVPKNPWISTYLNSR